MSSNTARSRKRYDSLELKPLSSDVGDDDTDEDGHAKSKTDRWLEYILEKLHAILWITIAGTITAYTQLIDVVINGHPPHAPERQLNR